MKKEQKEQISLYEKQHSLKKFLNFDRLFLLIFTKTRRKFLTRIAIFFTKIGNGQLWMLFSFSMFLYYVPVGVAFTFAILVQLYIQLFLKNMVKRARPYKKYIDLEALYQPPDPYSFPSGHTCAVFTMVFVSQMIFPITFPFFLVVALIISFSRIYLAVHYPSDVFAGIIIAYISANTAIMLSTLVTGVVL